LLLEISVIRSFSVLGNCLFHSLWTHLIFLTVDFLDSITCSKRAMVIDV